MVPSPSSLSSTSVEPSLPIVNSVNILVVDDEPAVLSVMEMLLRRAGHVITACVNGEAAIIHYLEHWEQIDLVVLDMSMPNMSGAEAATAMRTINPGVKVILASGLIADELKATIDDVDGFLQKPFNLHMFIELIDSVLRN